MSLTNASSAVYDSHISGWTPCACTCVPVVNLARLFKRERLFSERRHNDFCLAWWRREATHTWCTACCSFIMHLWSVSEWLCCRHIFPDSFFSMAWSALCIYCLAKYWLLRSVCASCAIAAPSIFCISSIHCLLFKGVIHAHLFLCSSWYWLICSKGSNCRLFCNNERRLTGGGGELGVTFASGSAIQSRCFNVLALFVLQRRYGHCLWVESFQQRQRAGLLSHDANLSLLPNFLKTLHKVSGMKGPKQFCIFCMRDGRARYRDQAICHSKWDMLKWQQLQRLELQNIEQLCSEKVLDDRMTDCVLH